MRKLIAIIAVVAFGAVGVAGYSLVRTLFAPQNKDQNPNVSFVGYTQYQNLSGKGLTEFPKDVLKDTKLEELDLSDNRLTGAFPAEIRNLVNLKILRASNNQLTGLPAEIGQLHLLEVLDVSYNRLTGLPNEIANLKGLQVLNLRGNAPAAQDLEYIRQALPGLQILL